MKNKRQYIEYLDEGDVVELVIDTPENFEPYFSWKPCDICGSNLGGNRWPVAKIVAGRGIVDDELEACQDCMEKIS